MDSTIKAQLVISKEQIDELVDDMTDDEVMSRLKRVSGYPYVSTKDTHMNPKVGLWSKHDGYIQKQILGTASIIQSNDVMRHAYLVVDNIIVMALEIKDYVSVGDIHKMKQLGFDVDISESIRDALKKELYKLLS